jgi:bacteriorhodopsin
MLAAAVTNVTLSTNQYDAVYNVLSLTIAGMGASFIALLLLRNRLPQNHRTAITLGTLVMAIADYHYVRIFNSWVAAYARSPIHGHYIGTGIPFNEAYRYVDWFLTVPLLLAELVAVLELGSKRTRPLMIKLIVASALMVALGYPGQISPVHSTARTLWAVASTVFFAYILFVLIVEINRAMAGESKRVRGLMNALRLLLLLSWGFYPIAYLLPSLVGGADGVVITQVGYSVADLIAKPVFTFLIFRLSMMKAEDEAGGVDTTSANLPSAA